MCTYACLGTLPFRGEALGTWDNETLCSGLPALTHYKGNEAMLTRQPCLSSCVVYNTVQMGSCSSVIKLLPLEAFQFLLCHVPSYRSSDFLNLFLF